MILIQLRRAKLIKEMKLVRDMLELVWLNPPNINYGLYVWHTEWRVFAMRKGSLVARQIFREVVENSATKINTARFLFVLTNHMKEQLSTVQLVSTERQEEILEQFRMRATISSTIAKPTTTAKSTTTTKTSKTTKPKSTSTTRTADKSAPEKDQSKSSKPSKEKSASKGKKSENKENRNPNKGKSFNQNKLALSRVSIENFIVSEFSPLLVTREYFYGYSGKPASYFQAGFFKEDTTRGQLLRSVQK